MKKRIILAAIFLLFVIGMANGMTAQNKLYFHHVASKNTWETEICIINKNAKQILAGELKAYNDLGIQITSLSVILKPNGRKSLVVGDDLPDSENIGYIIFESDSNTVCGYIKLYEEGKSRAAIPATADINTGDIYISHIASNKKWWTGVSLLNTTPSSKTIKIQFDNGITKTKTIAAKEHQVFTIKSLFNDVSQPPINSAVIKDGNGIIGLELFGSTDSSGNKYLGGIPLKDDTATTLYYPHIASNDKWWTGIIIYNSSGLSWGFTITPYKKDGTVLPTKTFPFDSKRFKTSAKALNFSDESAWFKLEASFPVLGFELLGTKNGKQLGGYGAINNYGTSGIFAQIEQNGQTGIAFVNIEDSIANVTITAFNDQGDIIATETIKLNAYEKKISGSSALFSQDIRSASYISYSSDRNIAGFQLNSSTDAMMLDALPGI